VPINAELTVGFAQKPKESLHFGVGGSALSKALKEGKELVGRTIVPVASIERLRFCEGLLLDSKVRVQVHLCRFHMLMAEPQGDPKDARHWQDASTERHAGVSSRWRIAHVLQGWASLNIEAQQLRGGIGSHLFPDLDKRYTDPVGCERLKRRIEESSPAPALRTMNSGFELETTRKTDVPLCLLLMWCLQWQTRSFPYCFELTEKV
jgi:hypothetical protein